MIPLGIAIIPLERAMDPVQIGIIPPARANTALSRGMSQLASGIIPLAGGMCALPRGMVQISGGEAAEGIGTAAQCTGMSQMPRGTFQRPTGAARGQIRMCAPPVGMSALPFRTLPLLGEKLQARLAIDRGSLAPAVRLNAEDAVSGEVLENSVEGAAVRLVTERLANLAARERLRKALERIVNISLHFGRSTAPGVHGRRERRLLRRSRWGSSAREGNRCLLFSLDHPDQVQSPNLSPVGGFHQLDARPKLLLEPSLAPFVFIASHDVHDYN
jgi:hypothetical protein